MFALILFLVFMSIGYFAGSICSAVIVCRLFELPNPRTEGSKNPGATNVLRIAGPQYAALVFLGDMLKGLLPVLLAKSLDLSPIIVGFTCVAAVFGHMYPIFFGFKGGKGVATALGAMLGFHFLVGVFAIATWLVVANFTRYASLASILSTLLAPFYSLFILGNTSAFLPLFFITVLIIYQHRQNIVRLMDGNENKLHFHKAKHHATSTTTASNSTAPSSTPLNTPMPEQPPVDILPTSPAKKTTTTKKASPVKKTTSTKKITPTKAKKIPTKAKSKKES